MTIQKGFTLIELLVTIAIAAIVATVGIPTFTESIRSSRLTTNINELVTALNFARSEAVKRNQSVSVIRTGANWEDGWDVITDADEGGDLDVEDEILRTYGARPNNFTLRSTDTFNGGIVFRSTGITMNGGGSFVLCDNSDGNNTPEAFTSRYVIISTTGRMQMANDTDNNGIPENNDNDNLISCTVTPFH